MITKSGAKNLQISAVVTRADGTVHDLGVIMDSSKRWRFGPGRLIAYSKIKRANRRIG